VGGEGGSEREGEGIGSKVGDGGGDSSLIRGYPKRKQQLRQVASSARPLVQSEGGYQGVK
jgi:hypothetical protein